VKVAWVEMLLQISDCKSHTKSHFVVSRVRSLSCHNADSGFEIFMGI